MIDKVLEFAVRQRVLVLMGALALLLVGLWSAKKLPIDAIPDITGVQVQVNTTVPALAPEEVEKLVTVPLEMALGGVPGVTEMRSLSRFGLSQITLQFTDKSDIYRARQLVTERLQTASDSLPPGLTPKLIPITTGLGEVFYYTIDYAPNAPNAPSTREAQLMKLWEIQEYIIKPQLRTVRGIAEVNAYGGYVKQIVVRPNIQKLRDAGLTANDLAKIVGENVENTGGGIVNAGNEQLVIRAVGRVNSPQEIAELPVKFGAAIMPLRVKDFADVEIGHAFRTGAATHGGSEAVLGVAMMLAGENSHAVAERVAEKVQDVQKQLPSGVVISAEYNRRNLVHRTIHTVSMNLFEGALLVVAVLLFLLGNWRAALIVATAIPLAFLFALIGMTRFGISGNLMSLGAIDFGLIIDGAVVVVENIVRQLGVKQHQLGRRLSVEERLHTVVAASKQVGTPMFFGVLIIAIVYLPILALSGIEGKMFHPMALTVMLALGGSLVLALTLMPALCSFVLRGKIAERDNFIIHALKIVYAPTVKLALRLRWLIVLGAVVLFATAIFIFRHLGADFIPKLDEGTFTMMVFRSSSISIEQSIEQQRKTEEEIQKRVPEITHVFSRIGSAEIATDPMPPSDCDFYVYYKPQSEWRKIDNRPISREDLAKIIATELEILNPGARIMVAQPVEMRFNEMLEGIRADIAVKIFGNDYDVLERLGSEVKKILEQIPGTREGEGEVEYETTGRSPMMEIRVKRDVLAKYNVHVGEVNQTIATALAGQTVGTMIEENHRFDIVLRMAEADRENVDAIRALPVRVGELGLLPLGDVADIELVQTVSPILRDSAQRRAALMVSLRGRDVESWVREADAKIREHLPLPEGYTLEFGGQFENLREAKARLAIVVPAALAFIFVLIFMAFGSLRQALLVYSGVPLAITGGVIALWLRDMPFSISAAVGFIALSGVAVLNGVVMISYFNQLRNEGNDVRSAVIEGSLTRLRPVLMTAAVAAFGFVPMALSTNAGAEVQRPLATVVIGGILSSTFLTLFLLPTLNDMLERRTQLARLMETRKVA